MRILHLQFGLWFMGLGFQEIRFRAYVCPIYGLGVRDGDLRLRVLGFDFCCSVG